MGELPERLSIAQLLEYLEEHGYKRSKGAIWQRINKSKTLKAQKVGNQWTVSKAQAEVLLESLRQGKRGKGT